MKKPISMKNNRAGKNAARAARTRQIHRRLKMHRLVVSLSGKHAYAQIISPQAQVVASAATVEKDMRAQFANGGNAAAAAAVGARLAEKVKAAGDVGFSRLAFDRGGRKYDGRVRALAEAARAGGLQF